MSRMMQGDVPGFLLAQGTAVAVPLFAWFFRDRLKGSG